MRATFKIFALLIATLTLSACMHTVSYGTDGGAHWHVAADPLGTK